MKVIFLDVDGVLNSVEWLKRIDPDTWVPGNGGTQLDPDAVLRLERIVQASAAKVVISSTWRKMYDHVTIEGFLRRHGFTGQVIGETVDHIPMEERSYAQQVSGRYERGWEIQAWLNEHPEVTHYAVLDDDSDMDGVEAHFVHTAHPDGLLDKHISQVLALLGV